MAEGEISDEAKERLEHDIARQNQGMAWHGIRQAIGINDFRPGDTHLTSADQAAFDAHLKATLRRGGDSQKPKGILERLRDLARI